jgi:hypothetical protein
VSRRTGCPNFQVSSARNGSQAHSQGLGAATPNDYKLFVFGGAVELIQTDMNRFGGHRQLLYTPAWKKLDVRYVDDDPFLESLIDHRA